jgi:hypothetical protein
MRRPSHTVQQSFGSSCSGGHVPHAPDVSDSVQTPHLAHSGHSLQSSHASHVGSSTSSVPSMPSVASTIPVASPPGPASVFCPIAASDASVTVLPAVSVRPPSRPASSPVLAVTLVDSPGQPTNAVPIRNRQLAQRRSGNGKRRIDFAIGSVSGCANSAREHSSVGGSASRSADAIPALLHRRLASENSSGYGDRANLCFEPWPPFPRGWPGDG